jgi:hypothetical protein
MAVKRKLAFAAVACAAWLAASAGAWSQDAALDHQVVGSWQLSKQTGNSGGLGPSAKGMLMFADGGGFMMQIVNANMKPFAADDWRKAEPAESQASGKGGLAYFGTYEASDADHALTLHILRSSYPNWIGTDQVWTVSLAGDELSLTDKTNAGEMLVWKRLPPISHALQLRGGRRTVHF